MTDEPVNVENQETINAPESSEVLNSVKEKYSYWFAHISTDPKKPYSKIEKDRWTVNQILLDGSLKKCGFTSQLSVEKRREIGGGIINFVREKAPEAFDLWMDIRDKDILIEPLQRGIFEQAKSMKEKSDKST